MSETPQGQSTQDLIDRVLEHGIEGLQGYSDEEKRKAAEAHLQQQHDLNVAIQKTFNSQAGKQVLQWLVGRTLCSPAFVPGTTKDQYQGVAAEQLGFVREGENNLVREIMLRMHKADHPPQSKKQGKKT